MKKLIFVAMLLSLTACDHDPSWDKVCVKTVDDGWYPETTTTYSHHSDSKGHSYSTPHTSFTMKHRTHCGQYTFVCSPGKKGDKIIPCDQSLKPSAW
jgi:hypothetical protein